MFAVVTLLAGVILLGVLGVATLLWGELEHWRASRRRMGTEPGHRGTGEAVVVLGFRNAGRRANVINRWRVRAGLRSQQPEFGPSRLILSGGSVAAKISEADLMAEYAREKRGYTGQLITEPHSRSTWENVQNVIPLIADADRIKIVSNSLHAEKARLYLRELRPDLAERLVPGSDYRFGELIIVKPALAALGRRNFRRLERKARTVGLQAGTTLPTADLNPANDANLSP
jgi:uncharacterized SAM-binding protein YcdF (DUF218 family)